MNHNIQVDNSKNHEEVEYNLELVGMIATIICDVNSAVKQRGLGFAKCFAQQYILKKGLEKFSERGMKKSMNELDQLYK